MCVHIYKMPSNKRGLLRTLITASLGCGCGCDKPDLSYIHVHEPSPPTPKITIHCKPNPCRHTCSNSATSGERKGCLSMADHEDLTSTVISEAEADHHKMMYMWVSCSIKNTVRQGNKLLIDSIAVEKDSEAPYKDFRMSMLQMIFEKEISAEVDLQELLACFLSLNSPCHHEVILEAFSQICQESFPEQRVQAADHDGSSKKPDRASSM